MVVDKSALLSIVLQESESGLFLARLSASPQPPAFSG